MTPRLLTMFMLVKSDISNDMFLAKMNQKMGKLEEAQLFYDTNFSQYSQAEAFYTSHIEFLLSIGDYDSIIRKYGHLNISLVKKANECIAIVKSRDHNKISKLIEISPYSNIVIKACIKSGLIEKKMGYVFNLINEAKKKFKNDKEILKLEAQYFCIYGDFVSGIEKLENLGFYNLSQDLKNAVSQFEIIDKLHDSNQKFMKFRQLYSLVNANIFSDNFFPSIFSKLMNDVLYKYVSLGCKLEQPGLVSTAKIYHNLLKTDETRYLYIVCLINDGQIEKATNEFTRNSFSNAHYQSLVKSQIEKVKEKMRQQKEEENRRQEQNRRQKRERQFPSTDKAGTDFLGYYKLLNVNKNMDAKKIKKAYLKIIAFNDKKQKNEKQAAEWEKKHAMYNKAYQVLSDKKKRELYDKGIDPDSPQAQQGGNYHHYEQAYKGFEDFGPFAEFFGGFNGRRGSFRRGGSTQYFYF